MKLFRIVLINILFLLILLLILHFAILPILNAINHKKTTQIATGIDYEQKNGFYTYYPNIQFSFINEFGIAVMVKTDENGLRNEPGSLGKAKILLLGDSFVSAVNTKYSNILSVKLSSLAGPTYNAGMDGFSSFTAINLLDHLLGKQVSSLGYVVLLFYLGNDFRDNYLTQVPEINLGRPNQLQSERMANYASAEMLSLQSSPGPEMQMAIAKTIHALQKLKALSQDHKFSVLVVGVPSKAQVRQSFKEISGYELDPEAKDRSLGLLSGGNFSFDNPDKVLKDLVHDFGFKYLSLLTLFRQNESNSKRLYGYIDAHWNEEGQSIAAQQIHNVIRSSFITVLD